MRRSSQDSDDDEASDASRSSSRASSPEKNDETDQICVEQEEDLLKNQPKWVRYLPRTGWKVKAIEPSSSSSSTSSSSSSSSSFSSTSATSISPQHTRSSLQQANHSLKLKAPGRRAKELHSASHPYSFSATNKSNDSKKSLVVTKTKQKPLTATEAALLLEFSQIEGRS